MAIQYKKYAAKRSDKFNKKVYARAVVSKTYGLNELADHLSEHNSTFSRGQIKGIITDLARCVRELCLDSKKVKLDNLGFFFATIGSRPSDTMKEWSPKKNVKHVRIHFTGQGETSGKSVAAKATLSEHVIYKAPKNPSSGGAAQPLP